eukprot:m51a1_g14836 hypothetical protein (525) ;mRNA; r:718850-720886
MERPFEQIDAVPRPTTYILFNDAVMRAGRTTLGSTLALGNSTLGSNLALGTKLTVLSDTPISMVTISDVPVGEYDTLGCDPAKPTAVITIPRGDKHDSGGDGDATFLVFFEKNSDKQLWTRDLLRAKIANEERSQAWIREIIAAKSSAAAEDSAAVVVPRLGATIHSSDAEIAATDQTIAAIRDAVRQLQCSDMGQIELDMKEIGTLLKSSQGGNAKFQVKAMRFLKDVERSVARIARKMAKKPKAAEQLVRQLHITYLAAKCVALSTIQFAAFRAAELERTKSYLECFEDDEGREFWRTHFTTGAREQNSEAATVAEFVAQASEYAKTLSLGELTEEERAKLVESVDPAKTGSVSSSQLAAATNTPGFSRLLQTIKGVVGAEDCVSPAPVGHKEAKTIVAWIDENQAVAEGMRPILQTIPGTLLVSFNTSHAFSCWLREHGSAVADRLRVVTDYKREHDGRDRAADRVLRYTRKILPSGIVVPVLIFCKKGDHELARRLEDNQHGVFVGNDAESIMKFLQSRQ